MKWIRFVRRLFLRCALFALLARLPPFTTLLLAPPYGLRDGFPPSERLIVKELPMSKETVC